MERLSIGDRIRSRAQPTVVREITEVRPDGYTWIYPDVPDKDFWSENSNDPYFEMGWDRIERAPTQAP